MTLIPLPSVQRVHRNGSSSPLTISCSQSGEEQFEMNEKTIIQLYLLVLPSSRVGGATSSSMMTSGWGWERIESVTDRVSWHDQTGTHYSLFMLYVLYTHV